MPLAAPCAPPQTQWQAGDARRRRPARRHAAPCWPPSPWPGPTTSAWPTPTRWPNWAIAPGQGALASLAVRIGAAPGLIDNQMLVP